jgi:uncharacterized protein
MKSWLSALLMLVAAPAALAETRASFTCTDARSDLEKLICDDPALQPLNVKLVAAYQAALSAGTVTEGLQLDWAKHGKAVCIETSRYATPASCLQYRYEQRIRDLSASPGTRPIGPKGPSWSESREVCSYVIARGPSIADELIKDGKLDANNDGRDDTVAIVFGRGTMAADSPPSGPPVRRQTSIRRALSRRASNGNTTARLTEAGSSMAITSTGSISSPRAIVSFPISASSIPTMSSISFANSRIPSRRACMPSGPPMRNSAPRLPRSGSSTSR